VSEKVSGSGGRRMDGAGVEESWPELDRWCHAKIAKGVKGKAGLRSNISHAEAQSPQRVLGMREYQRMAPDRNFPRLNRTPCAAVPGKMTSLLCVLRVSPETWLVPKCKVSV
jgi:hypothetical protein